MARLECVGQKLCNLGLDAGDLLLADGDIKRADARDSGEGAQRVDEDGQSAEREKLLGLRGGHAGADAGGGQNDEDLHVQWSIQREGR